MSHKIGVDISGGDFAPAEIFKGAMLAHNELGEEFVLIGSKDEILKEAKRENVDATQFSIVDAPEKIEMNDPGALSIRKKKKSSIVVGMDLLKQKKIDAFVSCGNTGAVVSAATLKLRLIEGVERAGISIALPTAKDVCLLMDVGANINTKPIHLLQYALMSSIYYSTVFNKQDPTVGLLNIGEEETKGSDFMRNLHSVFAKSPLNFVGNVEAKHLFSGNCDCVVCDGLLGNVALKVSEGVAEMIGKFLLDEIRSSFFGKIGYLFMKKNLKRFKEKIDYKEYGGAPLLGVNGVVIIGHGRSTALAVKSACKVALEEVKRDVVGQIRQRINQVSSNQEIMQSVNI